MTVFSSFQQGYQTVKKFFCLLCISHNNHLLSKESLALTLSVSESCTKCISLAFTSLCAVLHFWIFTGKKGSFKPVAENIMWSFITNNFYYSVTCTTCPSCEVPQYSVVYALQYTCAWWLNTVLALASNDFTSRPSASPIFNLTLYLLCF